MTTPCPFFLRIPGQPDALPCGDDGAHAVRISDGFAALTVMACDAHYELFRADRPAPVSLREPEYLSDEAAVDAVKRIGRRW